MNLLIKQLSELLCVKSLVTLVLTVVFAAQTCRGSLDQGFMTVYTMVISFYFGTQIQKSQGGKE